MEQEQTADLKWYIPVEHDPNYQQIYWRKRKHGNELQAEKNRVWG